MADQQQHLKATMPLTDVAYFAANINNRGELSGVPAVGKNRHPRARRHLVLAEIGSDAGLMHFVLAPEFPMRDRLVADLQKAAGSFDGVQIDFEDIASYDKENFLEFLRILKIAIGDKILSVAVPSRTRAVNDPFDYERITALADRVLVMAYDEHWSTSAPGSIASPSWSRAVANYALKAIGPGKLIMGLPLYGRIWSDKDHTGAYRFTTMERLQKENQTSAQRDAEGIPYFKFSATINYTAYYEDVASLLGKTGLYLDRGIKRIGFWRLGLEDGSVWSSLKILQPGVDEGRPMIRPVGPKLVPL
jgi:spore germination protein YaaH